MGQGRKCRGVVKVVRMTGKHDGDVMRLGQLEQLVNRGVVQSTSAGKRVVQHDGANAELHAGWQSGVDGIGLEVLVQFVNLPTRREVEASVLR